MKKRSKRIMSTPEGRRMAERERVWMEAVENLCFAMKRKRVSPAGLARRLDQPEWMVRETLSGDRVLDLGWMANAFHALKLSMHVSFGEPTEHVQIPKQYHARPNGRGRGR